jgi:hypothetical protein
MTTYQPANYMDDGGDRLVVGGTFQLYDITTHQLAVTVDCSTSAASQDVGDIPAGAVVLAAQANLDTAITVGGTSNAAAGVGLGTASDPDKYGFTAAVTKNTKLTTLPDYAAGLAAKEDVILSPVDNAGTVPTSNPAIGGTDEQITVVITYILLADLPDA